MKAGPSREHARAVLAARRGMLEAFEAELSRRSPPDHAANLRIAEALWREAVALGALPPSDPLEGVEVDVALARALRVRGAP
ncbi:MAG TPA: hypothetical protein VFR85_20720 [Anaeromyxobacteraceae bacterium]|nr:hypothetical protein [Anaeromyxobacteraceae bacterium]